MTAKFSHAAVELGCAYHGRIFDIELQGTEALMEHNDFIRRAIENNVFTKESLFSKVFTTDHQFFYLLEKYEKTPGPVEDRLLLYERGVGSIEISDGVTVLKRDIVVAWGTSPNEMYPADSQPIPFTNEEENSLTYIIVSSAFPATYSEALAAPHTLISSQHEPFLPHPVELQENSFLGRKDDVIQAIDMSEFPTIEGMPNAIVESISKSQRQIQLKARRLDLTRKNSVVGAPVVRVTPEFSDKDKPPAQKGCIIYNTDKECLQFYNGEKWLTVRGVEE